VKFYYADAPENFKESSILTVKVIDSCNPPASYGGSPATFTDSTTMDDIDYIAGSGLLQIPLSLQVEPVRCAASFVELESSDVIFTGVEGAVARVNTLSMTIDIDYSAIDDTTIVGHTSAGKTNVVTVSFRGVTDNLSRTI